MSLLVNLAGLLVSAMLASTADGPGQSSPSADDVLAHIAAAQGLPPTSSYERISYTRSGITGTQTTVRSDDDFRETDAVGALVSEFGSVGKQRWHQNENGQTVFEESDPADAAEEHFTYTVSRTADTYVLARLNAAGFGVKEYVDARTWQIMRTEDVQPTQTTVVTYSDFRSTAGYTRAWRWTVRDGHPENDGDFRIDAFVARTVSPEELAAPKPRRALVEFPAGVTKVDVPVHLIDNQFIVRVTINGRGLDFLLDSGADGIVLDDGIAAQLALTRFAKTSTAANAGRVAMSTAIVPAMNVGKLQMHDVVVSTEPGLSENYGDAKVVGLLGFDFIAELLLQLDYEKGTVTASSGDFELPATLPAGSIALTVRLGDQIPLAKVIVNGSPGERFAIDTGAEGSILIFDYFARRYPHALVDLGGGDAMLRNTQNYGIGGAVDAKPYQLADVTIGTVHFNNFVAFRVVERKSYSGSQDGLIGVHELALFTVWLDYANGLIVMVPNAEGRRAMHIATAR